MEAQTPGRAQPAIGAPILSPYDPLQPWLDPFAVRLKLAGSPSPPLAFPLPRRRTEQARYPARAAAALASTERGWRRRNHGNFAAEEKYKGKKGDMSLKILVLEIHNICIYPIIQVLCLFFF